MMTAKELRAIGKSVALTGVVNEAGFILGLAVKDEPGYYPQFQYGTFKTYEDACETANELNRSLGVEGEEAWRIIASSMRTQNQKKKRV